MGLQQAHGVVKKLDMTEITEYTLGTQEPTAFTALMVGGVGLTRLLHSLLPVPAQGPGAHHLTPALPVGQVSPALFPDPGEGHCCSPGKRSSRPHAFHVASFFVKFGFCCCCLDQLLLWEPLGRWRDEASACSSIWQ